MIKTFCFIAIAFLSISVQALPNHFFRALESEQIRILDYKEGLVQNYLSQSLPNVVQKLRNSKFSWSPNFTQPSYDSCSPFKELNADSTLEESSAFFQKCEKRNRIQNQNLLTQSWQMLSLNYPMLQSPLGRTIQFKLKGGITVRGQLLLKGNTIRPLVIVRMGIFSTLSSAVAERYLPMSLFDEGPFHLLILPSMTGADFIADNSDFIYGGFEEGMQTFQILSLIKDSKQPIHSLFSDVYTVGISMGGHGMLWTNLLASNSNNLKIQRSLLLCPLTHLDQNWYKKNSSFLTSLLIENWIEKRTKPLIEKYGSILNADPILSKSSFQWKNLFNYFEKKYSEPYAGWPSDFSLKNIPKPLNFFTLNNFIQWWKSPLTTETLVLYNNTDPAVEPKVNSEELTKYINGADKFLRVVKAPNGIHCSLPAAYDWSFISGMMRNYFQEKKIFQEVSWSQAFSGVFARELHNSKFNINQVTLDDSDENVTVKFTLYRNKFYCRGELMKIPKLCKLQTFYLKIPNTAFDFEWESSQDQSIIPTLHRWLTNHLQIREQPDGFWLLLYRPVRTPSLEISEIIKKQESYVWQ